MVFYETINFVTEFFYMSNGPSEIPCKASNLQSSRHMIRQLNYHENWLRVEWRIREMILIWIWLYV